MNRHQDIDRRSLALARLIVERIDADPGRTGLLQARATCARWARIAPSPAVFEWLRLLDEPWERVREILLRDDEEGQRLRQSSPFTSVLTPRERWDVYRRFGHEPAAA